MNLDYFILIDRILDLDLAERTIKVEAQVPNRALVRTRARDYSLTRFLLQISLRNLRKLDCYANRYPPRIKSGAGFHLKTL